MKKERFADKKIPVLVKIKNFPNYLWKSTENEGGKKTAKAQGTYRNPKKNYQC